MILLFFYENDIFWQGRLFLFVQKPKIFFYLIFKPADYRL